jgi:flavin-dependent dehydrogenase
MTSVETIIVGGGPAGAAAAIRLAAAGREALLIERHAEPHHKVCGEFLSIETQDIVRRLGVDLGAQGAVPIESVSIHAGRNTASAALPFRALSLSRGRFDAALLDRAQQAGGELKRGVAVQAVTRENDSWSVRCDDGANLQARHLIVATGKHGLRGVADSRDGSLVGLKMHLRLRSNHEAALTRQVELFMLERAYVGLELVEDGLANLCLVMARQQATRLGPGWPALRDHLAAHAQLGARLEGAEPEFDKPLAVVCPDGGHLHDESAPAAYRVGDRLAHIPPFTGDGMAIAVASGALAAEHIIAGQSPAVYLDAAHALTAKPIRLAAMVSQLAASRAGRTFLVGAAALVPGLIAAVTRRTRLDRAALPIQMQNYSYASPRADTGGGISARSSAG